MATALIKVVYRANINSVKFDFKNVVELKRFLAKYADGSNTVILTKVTYTWNDSTKVFASVETNLNAADLQ